MLRGSGLFMVVRVPRCGVAADWYSMRCDLRWWVGQVFLQFRHALCADYMKKRVNGEGPLLSFMRRRTTCSCSIS